MMFDSVSARIASGIQFHPSSFPQIQIKSNTTNKLLGQMSLNATTQSVVINSLIPGGRYVARIAAQTAGGLGPYSQPAALHMDMSFVSKSPK